MSGTRNPGLNREVVVVTGTMTLTDWHVGKTLLVESSGATTLTLPTPARCPKGGDILVINSADQNLIISLENLLIAKNTLVGDTVAAQQAGELIGTAFWCINTGAKWAVLPIAEEAVSIVVTAG